MQITFLVGNGFDISCGIHSSYSCFYEWYCKQEKSEKEHVNIFRESINNDILAGNDNWADFEAALGKYTSEFTKDTAYQFIECYEDAHQKLMEYLKQETMRFADDIDNNEIEKIRSGLKSFYGELPPKEVALFNSLFQADIGSDSIIRFISFNYTSILDQCIAKVAKEPLNAWTAPNNYRRSFRVDPNIIHVHGLLNRYPVFGVNDESQIANKELLTIPDFAQLMIKPKCINGLGELWHSESEKIIQNSNIICVFGMSMGITDTKWFERIMNWLKASDDRYLIIFWHTDNPSNGFSPWTVFKNKREARNRITDFSDLTSMAIEAISSRIHVIENTESVLRVNLKAIVV